MCSQSQYPMDTQLKKAIARNGNRAFIREKFSVKNPIGAGEASEARELLYDFALWLMAQLSRGKRVSLSPAGTWGLTFRKARSGVGSFRVQQPDQYVVKFYPSPSLSKILKDLAVRFPNPADLPMNRMQGKGRGNFKPKAPCTENAPSSAA